MRSDADIQNLVPRLIIGVAVVLIGLYLGKMVPTNMVMAGAVVTLAFLIFLLVTRPHYFTLLLLFFMFEAFSLVDVDSFGRLPGLFRAKDALLFLLLAYTMATAALGGTPLREARQSQLFKVLLAFLAFVALQMMRTHFLLGERFMLLFRAGRHFLTYGMALFLIIYFRDARRWRLLMRWAFGVILLIFGLNMLRFFGVQLPFYATGMGDAWIVGAVKFYNPAMCLSFWFFLHAFWSFCTKPSGRGMVYLGLMTTIVMTYSFRALWSGLLAGMFVTWLMVPNRVKSRSALLFTIVMISAVTVAVIGIAFSERGDSIAEAFATFMRYVSSTVTDLVNVEGSYYSRSVVDAQRIPLIKEHPLMGIGFVSVFGEIALDMWMQGNLPVGTVDTGWIDLLLKLGGIGVVVLGVLFVQIIRVNHRLLKTSDPQRVEDRSWMLANIGYIVLITTSSVAAALPSWEPGIVTVAMIIAQTMRFELGVDQNSTAKDAPLAQASAKIIAPMPNQV
ncbi:MAG TPA: hypothetical protein PLE77_06150 [Kiritimatiellia bacterium]|nr:hypothetical protein [Kiritimatiellia bacterium]